MRLQVDGNGNIISINAYQPVGELITVDVELNHSVMLFPHQYRWNGTEFVEKDNVSN